MAQRRLQHFILAMKYKTRLSCTGMLSHCISPFARSIKVELVFAVAVFPVDVFGGCIGAPCSDRVPFKHRAYFLPPAAASIRALVVSDLPTLGMAKHIELSQRLTEGRVPVVIHSRSPLTGCNDTRQRTGMRVEGSQRRRWSPRTQNARRECTDRHKGSMNTNSGPVQCRTATLVDL